MRLYLMVAFVVFSVVQATDLAAELALLRKTVERLEKKVACKKVDDQEEEQDDEVSTYFIGAGVASSGVVEVFQLSSNDRSQHHLPICRKRANIPFEEDQVLTSPVVSHFQDRILVCGGSIHLEPVNTCRIYNMTTNTWIGGAGGGGGGKGGGGGGGAAGQQQQKQQQPLLRLLQVRYNAVSATLSDGRWWILGGADEDNEPLRSTEIYDPAEDTFRPGPDLPVAASHHCFVRINDTHFFFTHGDLNTRATWLYSQKTKEWIPLPGTNKIRHRRSVCGYVERRGFGGVLQREVVVAGGAAESFAHRATEILDLDALVWRQGPPLPDGFSNALVMPWKSSFLIFGGDNEIFEFVEELWVPRWEKMRRKQALFGSFLIRVPNDMC